MNGRDSSALRDRSVVWIADWAALWGAAELPGRVRLTVSARMRTTLGRCHPERAEVRIASFLLDASESLLREVVCHEVAHAAVHELHGRAARPHGREWKALMRTAGYEPRVRFPAGLLAELPAPARNRGIVWEHRCPVCHAVRVAGRPVRQWRCGRCHGVGLSGEVVIERRSSPGDGAR
jgi:predicted SprT family Zn-dependent metalloprotease